MEELKMQRACVEFVGLDISEPRAVASFIESLYWGKTIAEAEKELQAFLKDPSSSGASEIDQARLLDAAWGMGTQRIGVLLWQLLANNYEEQFFSQKFRLDPELLTEHARNCLQILKPIQVELRGLFDSHIRWQESVRDTGQAAWGEEWWLPLEEAEALRRHTQLATPDLVDRPSDYEKALRSNLEDLQSDIGLDIPTNNAHRCYVGVRIHEGRVDVHIEDGTKKHELWQSHFCHGFEWGYGGGGPSLLALSIIVDATDGDLGLAQKLRFEFRDDVIALLPREGFCLPRKAVIDWLATRGVTAEHLRERQNQRERLRKRLQPTISQLNERLLKIKSLKRYVRAQRFFLVAPDFECAIYVDFMEMLKDGGSAAYCSYCRAPIGFDNFPKSNRQRARWVRRRPIYHQSCSRKHAQRRKHTYWQRRSQQAGFAEKERKRIREFRRREKRREVALDRRVARRRQKTRDGGISGALKLARALRDSQA